MLIYTTESLENLRQRIDLVDVVTPYVKLTRSGRSHKGCCPFHQEKTPSFMIQQGESHYHCFGCGAHGDAIAFLMNLLKMSFTDAIETLAERFQVRLERVENRGQDAGPSKTLLKEALEKACAFYHTFLLHTKEGEEPLQYLIKRGLSLDFIRHFRIGFAPPGMDALQRVLSKQGVSESVLQHAGLIATAQNGRKRDFFSDRITFPIQDGSGAVIGFSARKFKEETWGGKYINTPETPLFKKSNVLFGLSMSRQRIAKERRAIIVEGQIDALQLIWAGFNFTVAGQGTAFGEGHARELLHLGVSHVFLALDGDEAGQEAAVKIGDLFQAKGVEVSVVPLPPGKDPDGLLKEVGAEGFLKILEQSGDYLTFLVSHLQRGKDLTSPSKKNELVQTIATRVRAWESPLMVHESLRKLAKLTAVPENLVGVGQPHMPPPLFVKRSQAASFTEIDNDRILESDLLRWLFLLGESKPDVVKLIQANLQETHFRNPSCRALFHHYINATAQNTPRDLLTLAIKLEKEEERHLLAQMMQKKVNLSKADEGLKAAVEKLLARNWMEERQAIQEKMNSHALSDDESLLLAREFAKLGREPPTLATAPQ